MISLSSSIIHILHTNDLHSRLEQWPKIVSLLTEKRKSFEQNGEAVLVFDIGDHADRVHPLTEASLGKANVLLMNEVSYNAVTIGNNEGITISKQALNELYDDANFPVLVANLYDINGERPDWLKPYEIMKLSNDITVGVIGMTIPFRPFYDALDWNIEDPFVLLPTIVKEVREQADLVILLSHLGLNLDEEVAKQIEGIDIIFGGHTHDVLEEGLFINNTIIHQAGKFGAYVGELSFSYDHQNKQILNYQAKCLPVNEYPACKQTVEKITFISQQKQPILDEEILSLTKQLPISWDKPSPFASFLATAVKEWCRAEVGMVNSGLLLEGLKVGAVTKADLHRICPHPINPCKLEISGKVLKETILYSLSEKMVFKKIRGFGFRGSVMGIMVFDGVTYEEKKLNDGLCHITNIKINGNEVEPDRVYKVATIDMFAFAHFYPALVEAKVKKYYMPELLRDLIAWKLKESASDL